MRILCFMALFILSGCIHNGDEFGDKPFFPSSAKRPGAINNTPHIDEPASARLPNDISEFEEFTVEPDGTIKFKADLIYFAYDTNSLTDKAMIQLQAIVTYLEKHPNVSIRIDGHADERGSTEYNMALGLQRGNSVQTYMSRLGIQNNRLHIITYGEEIPVDPDHNEAAWAQNRRVEFKVKTH